MFALNTNTLILNANNADIIYVNTSNIDTGKYLNVNLFNTAPVPHATEATTDGTIIH